jgi:hypothetical protein
MSELYKNGGLSRRYQKITSAHNERNKISKVSIQYVVKCEHCSICVNGSICDSENLGRLVSYS